CGHTETSKRRKYCSACERQLPEHAAKPAPATTPITPAPRRSEPKFVHVQFSAEKLNGQSYLKMHEKPQASVPTSPVKRPTGDRVLPVADVHMLDPVMVNPASTGAIKTILDELAVKLNVGRGPGQRRWVAVCVDGVP